MWQKLCKKNELSSAQLQKYLLAQTSVLATLDDQNAVFVFDAMCPHAGKTLHQAKWDSYNRHLTCLFHWAKYDVSQGGKPLSGPTSPSLTVYKTEVRFENCEEIVYIDFETKPGEPFHANADA